MQEPSFDQFRLIVLFSESKLTNSSDKQLDTVTKSFLCLSFKILTISKDSDDVFLWICFHKRRKDKKISCSHAHMADITNVEFCGTLHGKDVFLLAEQ